MTRLLLAASLLGLCSTALAAEPSAAVTTPGKELPLAEYAPIVAASNVSLYAIVHYVTVEADRADGERLRTLASALARLIEDFGAKLAALRVAGPKAAALQPSHRAVVRRLGDLQAWSGELSTAFAAGDAEGVLRHVGRGRHLFKDLREAYNLLVEEAGKVAE